MSDTTSTIGHTTIVISEGKQGPPGADGWGVYVQDTQPAFSLGEKAIWVQTNIGINHDFTFWIEDGT